MTATTRAEIQPQTRRHRAGLWLLCGMQLLVAMEFSIINIAIPNLQDTFGVSPALSHWVVTGYAVGFAALLFLGGRASERWGPKNVILWGISGFTMTSLLAALAWSFDVLIVARVAQGASAALVAPSALAFLTQLTSSAERPRWLGMWGAAASAGFAAGVVLGGVLVGVTGWRSVFVFCTILAATLGAAAASILPRMRESGERVDIIGALLFATASISLVAVLSLLSNESSRGPWLLGLAAVALLGFVSLSYQQRRTPNPLVPPELLARRSVRAAAVLSCAAPLSGGAMVYFASIYMQDVLGWSRFASGCAFLPDAAAAAAGAYVAPRLLRAIGPHRAAFSGFIAMALGLVTLSVSVDHGFAALVQVIVGTSLAGFGLVLCGVVAIVVGSRGLRSGEHGASAGILTAAQQWGVAAGLALASSLVEISAQLQSGTLGGGVIALMAATAIALVDLRKRLHARRPARPS
ncbi:putative MFS family arabinose efflux permease [Rathayibacter iranicus NCPPB 2253 = VKM Ac-1602]|nr:putative MFS family arabinose efflux permease [Rathayibacter iranicus NCPPB 2253 = VKM Ac-1602]